MTVSDEWSGESSPSGMPRKSRSERLSLHRQAMHLLFSCLREEHLDDYRPHAPGPERSQAANDSVRLKDWFSEQSNFEALTERFVPYLGFFQKLNP